jgi:glycine/D-amino acid oxidase-like deaminating enzyme
MDGEPGTVGTVAVVGMGKIGLPLAAQYADAGWHVIGVDVIPTWSRRSTRDASTSTRSPGSPNASPRPTRPGASMPRRCTARRSVPLTWS